jgi:glutaredoxin
MRKYLVASLIVVLLIVPIAGASFNISKDEDSRNMQCNVLNEDFTHKVFVEFAATTACPYCVTASSQLFNIYDTGNLDFCYVSLAYHDEAHFRVTQRILDLDVTAVPDVFFDGKYKHITSGQNDEQPYIDAITQSGTRDIADIDIDVDVSWQGGGNLKTDVTVVNNEPEEFNGILRIYIIERVSRWKDQRGNPFNFAALDIPLDQSLTLVKNQPRTLGDTYTFTNNWFGSVWGFGDITKENTLVIAAVFESGTDHAVQVAIGEPSSDVKNYQKSNILMQILENLVDHYPLLKQILKIG